MLEQDLHVHSSAISILLRQIQQTVYRLYVQIKFSLYLHILSQN